MKRIAIILACILSLIACSDDQIPMSVQNYRHTAKIYPDYMGVTVPSTIAPLNFSYQTDAKCNCVTTFSFGNKSFSVKGRKVRIDPVKWRDMLQDAAGSSISVHSSVLDTTWNIFVSTDAIDYGLNYRLIEPSYEIYSKMGIYERELSTYRQTPLIENTEYFGCCNCHSHRLGDPKNLSMHIRGPHGCTLIMKDGELTAYNTKTDTTLSACVYTNWHPSGDYICYSLNTSHQGFHALDHKVLEVFDQDGDVVVYDIRKNQLILSDVLMNPGYIESFPSFSPDGKYLYFLRFNHSLSESPTLSPVDVRYSLFRVSFDAENGKIGESPECLIDCDEIGQGVCMPKPSPDGKYIMYVRADYGIFPSWHHESELYLYNLLTGEDRKLSEVNSLDSEGCHGWGTNSRWFVFGSRRDDGLFTRTYIAHFDPETGRCGKPFMLPQEDPELYYSSLFFSYNIPEFVTGPMVFDHVDAEKKIHATQKKFFDYRMN